MKGEFFPLDVFFYIISWLKNNLREHFISTYFEELC